MNDSIESVIANSIAKWSQDYPKIAEAIALGKYFSTVVRERTIHKFGKEGLLNAQHQDYAYVDLMKPPTLNKQEHVSHANYLHNLFDSIKTFYRC